MKFSKPDFSVVLMAVFLSVAAMNVVAQAPAMERTEHQWKSASASSTFDVLWSGKDMKMIREELQAADGFRVKNEYMFNQGTLLHYKQDRYPAEGKSGPAEATMASFDKTGKPVISIRRVDGNAAGPASTAAIAAAKKHLAELLAITGQVKR
ncbi:MAG: hypothetical protein AB7E73_07315 [Burkholderiales bacterium]